MRETNVTRRALIDLMGDLISVPYNYVLCFVLPCLLKCVHDNNNTIN